MSAEDKIRNAGEKVTGEAKKVVGKVTDDERLEAEGERESAMGDLKQSGEKLKPAFTRQTEVKQKHFIHIADQRRFGRDTVTHPVNRVAVLSQTLLNVFADHRIVFDEQYAHRINA